MARSIRIEYPGAFYHTMARGNRRESIFHDDDDRRFFLKALSEACEMTGWRIHAWVLMGNHYHLLLETPEPNLVAGMQWLQNTYTRRFNTRHRLWGRLFGDRYKAVPVEGNGWYYETLLDYIHLNPVRAGLAGAQGGLGLLEYPWSSLAGGYCLPARKRPRWLAAAEGLKACGFADTTQGRNEWLERLERRALEEGRERCGLPFAPADADARLSTLQRGWYWGSRAFAERLLEIGKAAIVKTRHRDYQASQESRAHGEAVALKLLQEGLAAVGLEASELPELPGNEKRKVAIAAAIRQKTTVSMRWIAEALSMRSAANASQQIRRHRTTPSTLPERLQKWIDQSTDVA